MKKTFIVIYTLLFTFILQAQIVEPVKWQVTCSEIGNNGDAVISWKADIDEGWHLYNFDLPKDGPLPTTFNFETKRNVKIVGSISTNQKPIEKFEPMYQMTLGWFEKNVTFSQHIKVLDSLDYKISGYVEFMVCSDKVCLPPEKENFSFGLKKNKEVQKVETAANTATSGTTVDTASASTSMFVFNPLQIKTSTEEVDFWKPVISELNAFGTEGENKEPNNSLWSVFWIGILGGLLAIVTPCVWPIIPMTVSFFLKRGNDPKKGKKAAIAYGLSIIFIYLLLGILITLIFGANALNALSTNAIFNVFIFVLLVLFAISFFGGFDLALPATWSTKIDNKADKTAGLLSILLMAFTLVIVSFSCTGPIIGTLLVHVSTGGNILAPAVGMLGFAVALAGPFTVFAFFPSWLHNMPRSGGWLNIVKVLLGFFELAFALKFLSIADLAYGWHILDREVFIVLWIVIFFFAGLYLLGKIRFKGDDKIEELSVPRFFSAAFSFAFVVYLIPGLFGAPLKAISAFAPPMWTQDLNLYQETKSEFTNYDEAMAYAAKHKKPVVVDFSGYGCVNCRKMEATVWNNPEVSSILTNDYVLVSLFVDDKKELPEPMIVTENGKEKVIKTVGEKWSYLQRTKFGANAQPFYVLLDNEGNALNHSFAFSENATEFIQFLKTGLENYKK